MSDRTPQPSQTDGELPSTLWLQICLVILTAPDIRQAVGQIEQLIQADRERLYGELETRLTKASYSSSREGRIVNLIVGLQVLNKVFNREGADNE